MILSISGAVARLDVASVDGRELSAEGLVLPNVVKPLMALHAGISPRLGHYGAEPVGAISAWDVAQEDDGRLVLEIVGDVYDDQRVPAGTYVCGLDCRFEDGDAELHPDDRWPDTGRLLVRKWSPIGVTLHMPGSAGTNAWPDLAPLTVEAR